MTLTGYEKPRIRGVVARASGEFSYRTRAYRRMWRASVTASFLNPLLMLTSLGVGLGKLVDTHSRMPGDIDYLTFVAPALLAGTAMQVAVTEATWPVARSMKWRKTYYAARATPLNPFDIFLGHLAYAVFRVSVSTGFFMAIMVIFGVIHSAWALLAFPAAVLTGAAFAAPTMALSIAIHESWFNAVFRLIVMPLYLFSGTFFPFGKLPGWLQGLAQWTPLLHGVYLCRMLSLGTVTPGASAGHVGYLLALAALGVLWARHNYRRKLRD